jgi:hypothetical protein
MASHRQLATLFAALERRRHAGASGAPKAPPGRLRHRAAAKQAQGGGAGAGGGAAPAAEGEGRTGADACRIATSMTEEEGPDAARAPAPSVADTWQRVGCHLATAVHVSMCVLLGTDVRQSATRAGVWRAQQCLQVGLMGERIPPTAAARRGRPGHCAASLSCHRCCPSFQLPLSPACLGRVFLAGWSSCFPRAGWPRLAAVLPGLTWAAASSHAAGAGLRLLGGYVAPAAGQPLA